MSSALEADLPRELTTARAARALLVTELVNNAVLHGRGSISLRAEFDEGRLHVDVVDEGSGFAHEVAEGGFDHVDGHGCSSSPRRQAAATRAAYPTICTCFTGSVGGTLAAKSTAGVATLALRAPRLDNQAASPPRPGTQIAIAW